MRGIPLAPDALDDIDRALINRLQDGISITPTPFADLGADMGLTETDVLTRIEKLRGLGALTRFGPFIDAAALGGAFCLCAMEVPAERFDAVVTLVNAHDEVAHNYERIHRLNMWFVGAAESPEKVEAAFSYIEKITGYPIYRFPKEQEYFVELKLKA